VSGVESSRSRAEAEAVVAAARAGDESAFVALVESYRRELQVHCYRMLGSFEDAEDMVQETFLRAWRKHRSFERRSSFRAWLYRIATNACLDALDHKARRVLPYQLARAADPSAPLQPAADLPWLQPYPDRLLEGVAPTEAEPESAVVSKETIELAFLAAIQHLPPRQRAALILRDTLGWSAKETASLLEVSVASVNSALHRARSTLRTHLPARRLEWAPASDPSDVELALLRRYMDAHERADAAALAGLLREDARLAMPPTPTWYDGREAIVTFHAQQVFGFVSADALRVVATAANRQPAMAMYVRRNRESEYRAVVIDVLRIEGGLIAEIDAFILPELFPAFGLPRTI
jgi:RNA polymerase sigma-70 factor (ECF subfamily)